MPDRIGDMSLAAGLSPATVAGLAGLIGDICGTAPDGAPWLAPALLFADPAVQARLDMPRPGPDAVLVQDYQSLTAAEPLPLDRPLTARAGVDRREGLTEYTFALAPADADAPAVTLGTALRVVPAALLAQARPAPFRAAALRDVAWSGPLAVTQARTDRYLALSGDANPIHRDPAQAARLGLPAPVVPGLLLASLIQPFARGLAPGAAPAVLKCRFMAPLAMAAPLRIGIQPRGSAPDGTLRARAYLVAADPDRALAIVDLQFRP